MLDELYVSSDDEESDDDCIDDEADVLDDNSPFYNEVNLTIDEQVKVAPKVYYDFKDLPLNDYRRNPYAPPLLDEKQKLEVDIKFKLLQQKGIFPYEYIDSIARLKEKELPLPDDFYNSLNDEKINEESYKRAQLIWEKFGMKSLWDYHDLYLKTDILFLADVLHSFQEMCIKYYKIDPFHSYAAPGFSWQAALKMTDVELELLSEKEMYTFCDCLLYTSDAADE